MPTQREKAGNPKAYENAIVPVYQEPEQDAREAEERSEKKRSIEFVKDNLDEDEVGCSWIWLTSCLIFV